MPCLQPLFVDHTSSGRSTVPFSSSRGIPSLVPAASYPHYHSSGRHGRGREHANSRPVIKFSEDFDFIAMNEKFNKAEVWDHLSKGKGLVEYEEKDIVSREEDDLCFQENGDQHCDGRANVFIVMASAPILGIKAEIVRLF